MLLTTCGHHKTINWEDAELTGQSFKLNQEACWVDVNHNSDFHKSDIDLILGKVIVEIGRNECNSVDTKTFRIMEAFETKYAWYYFGANSSHEVILEDQDSVRYVIKQKLINTHKEALEQ